MDKAILFPSVLFAMLLLGIYWYRCWKNKVHFDLSTAVTSTFNASGVICGVALISSLFFPEVKSILGGIDIYIFIGGLAVLIVSVQGINKAVFQASKPDD